MKRNFQLELNEESFCDFKVYSTAYEIFKYLIFYFENDNF